MKKFTILLLLIVAGLVSFAQTAEQEPNNSFATANYISKDNIKTGSIASGSDYDYFVAHLPMDGTLRLYVKATNTSGTTNYLYFSVFGSNKAQLTARYIAGTSSVAAGVTIFDTITLYGRGVDSLFCRFQAIAAFSYEFKYEIVDTSTNDAEPNDSFAQATLINQNEKKEGHIKYILEGQLDNYDYFCAKTSYDGTFKVFVSATNTSGVANNCYLSVYASNKTLLAAIYIGGTSSVPAGLTAYDTITLYGRGVDSVFFRFESNGTFSYNFEYDVIETKNNDAEPNGSFASATYIGQNETKKGHIKYILNGVTDDYDYYRAKTSYDGMFKVYVSATNTSGATNWAYLTIYGSNKIQLAAEYTTGSSAIPSGATVYDTITLYGRGVDSVFFRFETSGTFSYEFKYDVIETKYNDAEPNGSFAAALTVNQNESKSGHIKYISNGVTDDYDYYRTKTSDDGTLKIYVSATNTSGAINWANLVVYGSNKLQLATRYISGVSSVGIGATVYDTITLYGRGIDSVFFRIEASGTFTYYFSYEIHDKSAKDAEPNNSFASAALISQNETRTGHIKYILNGIVDDYDYYRAKTSDDGTLKIYVSATNTSGAVNWANLIVYGSNKLQLATRYISGVSNIGIGATVYDTITLYGRGIDSVFFRFEASGTFTYYFRYEIHDKSSNDAEPNGGFAVAIPVSQIETKPGHIKYVLNGVIDDYDYYRTRTSDDGTVKIYVSATNTGDAATWLYLNAYGSNRGLLEGKYITGTSSIPPGVKVYDTITLKGIGVDSVFFRFEASGTFSYDFKYEIADISANDTEPNNSFATAIKTDLKQIKSGHLMYKAKGTTDQDDYYVTPVSAKGSLKILVELTNISGSPGWVYLYGYNKSKTIVLSQYVKGISNLPAGELIRDTVVLNCAVLDTFYLRWTASGLTNYRFSVEMIDRQPYANMTHERLGNTIGFRPQLANADKFLWDFGDGTVSTQKFPMKTYPIGYYATKLIATNSVCNYKDTAFTSIEVKGVEYYTPDTSGVGGDCIVKIFGGGLDSNTKVRLKMGETELTPIKLETSENNVQLHAIFDFHLVDEGTYDVVIEIKGQEPIIYPGGFKLKAFRYPYTWSEIISPSRMRTNLNTSMKLLVGNKGNVMASGVLVAVIWPKSVDLRFDTKWFKPPATGNYSITAADTTFNFKWEDIQPLYSDTLNTVTAIDTFNLQPYDGFMRLILIPKIAAGSTFEIPLIVKTTSTGAKDFITYTFKPNLFGSCNSGSWMDASENMAVECADGLDKLVSINPVLEKSPVGWLTKAVKGTTKHMANLGQVMGATYNYATGVTPDIYSSLPADFNSNVTAGNMQVAGAVLEVGVDKMFQKGGEKFMKGQTDDLNKWIAKNPNASASSIDFAIDNLNNINDVRNFIKSAHQMVKNGKDLNDLNEKIDRLQQLVKDCPELQKQLDELTKNLNKDMTLRDPKFTRTGAVTSFDPNEIIGPVGIGENQYVLKQEKQHFAIFFENKNTALAAAQIVTVSDTLDATKFDLNTFEFTDFTIANKTYTVPKGRQEFVLEDSLSPGMKVRINGKLEISSGEVTWQFTAIDPATGDIPVFDGFLPPNKIMPEGEGSVSFTILPKQTLADGAVIKNRASIIFDQNDPILTNTWQNIVDALPPSGTVSATRVEGSREIHLTFNGSDAASGIAYYDIHIQEDGGEWLAFGNAYGDTETILADSSKKYNLYVVAYDQVGNNELKIPVAETTIGINELIKGKGQLSLGPNPATGIVYIGGLKKSGTFIISDLSGKKVLSGIVSENNNSIDIFQLTSGMYIISIYSNGSFESLKLIKTPGK